MYLTHQSTYDLPPSVVAKPLPTRDLQSKPSNKKNKKKETDAKTKWEKFETKNKIGLNDDTPKAFRRLMQYQQARAAKQTSTPSRQDAGKTKKRKRDAIDGSKEESMGKKKSLSASAGETATGSDNPKILPGEKLSDFAARVDRELPLSAMKRSSKPTVSDMPDIREAKLTKHERRLRRLQRQWREEEERIKEREREEMEEREANMDDQIQLWKQWEAEAGKRKKKGTATKKNRGEEQGQNDGDPDSDDGNPDPWAKLNNPDRVNQPVNPFDVAQAPPQLTKLKGKFKVRGGARVDVANVPAAVGSLRRREELASERRDVVEEYRRLMAERRS